MTRSSARFGSWLSGGTPDKQRGDAAAREEAEEVFKQIALAWDCLGDSEKRNMYDAQLAQERGGGVHDVSGGSSAWEQAEPCGHCGGICAPGECPFAGAGDPFASRGGDGRVRKTNRRSGERDYHGPPRRRSVPPSFGLEQAEAIFRAFFEDFNDSVARPHEFRRGQDGRRDGRNGASLSLIGGGRRGQGMSLFDDDPASGGDSFFSADWFHTSSF